MSPPSSEAPSKSSKIGLALRCVWRLCTFICLVAVLSFYVPVIAAESVNEVPLSSQWVYVLVLVALSGILMVADFFVPAHSLFALHYLITILWLAAFGVFAKLFLSRPHARNDEFAFTDKKDVNMRYVDTGKMQTGVWVLFLTTLLWAAYAAYTTIKYIKYRRARKESERRAESYQLE